MQRKHYDVFALNSMEGPMYELYEVVDESPVGVCLFMGWGSKDRHTAYSFAGLLIDQQFLKAGKYFAIDQAGYESRLRSLADIKHTISGHPVVDLIDWELHFPDGIADTQI